MGKTRAKKGRRRAAQLPGEPQVAADKAAAVAPTTGRERKRLAAQQARGLRAQVVALRKERLKYGKKVAGQKEVRKQYSRQIKALLAVAKEQPAAGSKDAAPAHLPRDDSVQSMEAVVLGDEPAAPSSEHTEEEQEGVIGSAEPCGSNREEASAPNSPDVDEGMDASSTKRPAGRRRLAKTMKHQKGKLQTAVWKQLAVSLLGPTGRSGAGVSGRSSHSRGKQRVKVKRGLSR
eukprot:SM000022S07174  [mRNA]  locus=s22:346589:347956:+ [translate_table: standard]